MSAIDRLIQGAIDIHVHFAPDPRVERRADAITTVRHAKELGMRALVLKSHEYPTLPVAYTVMQAVPGIQVYGAVCLDEEVGGLNPKAVEAAARMGTKVVWMPTFSAAGDPRHQKTGDGITILDGRGRLLPVVEEVLRLVRQYDLVLATGHLTTKESFALVEAARARGITRIVVTHASTMAHWTGMTVEDQKALAARGALIEHCVHAMMPLTLRLEPKALAEQIQAVGADSCILSTDLGQAYHPMPAEGLRQGIATLLQVGLSEEDVAMLVQYNPARLLGLGG
ncbi:MAG: hypothetical protein HY683_00065 [Chloroflexi bacterium]|nr:hypothetical protein [Chloroflexota bacterium]